MDRIQIQLFNMPVVKKNGSTIFFPLKKAEALFYYLLVKKQASRDELATLLWGELTDQRARKNLRNVMYKIRKAVGLDIIFSPQQQMVILNPHIEIVLDLDIFLKNEMDSLDVYIGEFLQGFWVKDANGFMEWMGNQREQYRDLFTHKLYRRIETELQKKNYNKVVEDACILIQNDEFDENAYRILMKIHAERGAYNKAIEVFAKLNRVLEKELGIIPDIKSKDLYRQILNLRNVQTGDTDHSEESFFYGRTKELQSLITEFKRFAAGESANSIIIVGEAGIGKTKLKEEFLKKIPCNEYYILESNCYQAEERYLLKPWNPVLKRVSDIIENNKIAVSKLWKNIVAFVFPSFASDYTHININPVEKIDTLKPKVIGDAIVSILDKISSNKKILLIFEDLQWIDTMSLSLLSNILLHGENKQIFFIGTLRTGHLEEIDHFLSLMNRYNRLNIMELNRFDKYEVFDFISQALSGNDLTTDEKERLYYETEGNTFFLIEYLNIIKKNKSIQLMTSRMQDILKSRIMDISDTGKKVLNIIALFFDQVALGVLKKVSGKSELKILGAIEELKSKFIIRETEEENQIIYRFTHHKLRDYIYSGLSLASKRILHNKVGMILEKSLLHDKRDILLYPRLIYHFSSARNGDATLKYSIRNANMYLDLSHELFPELSQSKFEKHRSIPKTKKITIKYLQDIENLLTEMASLESVSDQLLKREIEFMHMKGRYLIMEGEYEEGVHLIKIVIQNSKKINDHKYMIKGYIQLVFFARQTHNLTVMEENLGHALRLARRKKYRDNIGQLLRLKGLSRMMSGHYQEAEALLMESIIIFEDLNQEEDKYSLSIAAAYNYVGDIRRCKKKFKDAISYYKKSISIARERNAFTSLALFLTNAGQAAFDFGNFQQAKGYLTEALGMYKKLDVLWGRSIAEGYISILLVKEGRLSSGLKYLKQADIHSEQLKSPYEMGLVLRVKAEIKFLMKNNAHFGLEFKNYLNQSGLEYCSKGINLLKKIKKCYEVEFLKSLQSKY